MLRDAELKKKMRRGLRITLGEVNNGLYFKSYKQYFSPLSLVVTGISILVVIGLSIQVFVDIYRR